jgi:hypothetical protein
LGNRPSLAFAGLDQQDSRTRVRNPLVLVRRLLPLLNHCGIRSDLLTCTVDRSPHEQGLHRPGTQIPILPPETIADDRSDYIVLLPWSLRTEITAQLSYVREWNARMVVPIPNLQID